MLIKKIELNKDAFFEKEDGGLGGGNKKA